jgi:CheY-like chemotaxis protein
VKPGWSILLVEDEALIAMDLRLRFMKEGAGRVRIVATGEESVLCAAAERFDVVVMDDHLAGDMRGIEAAERIRAAGDVPIIFISGYPKDDGFFARTAALRPAACLDKPIDFRRLMTAIHSLPE